ncbi:MAG: SHOCT domain-containing protein [Firmicutes bacterium]|nr:SHOCT domain-containing protein [Bacillota bacterium]
MMGYGFGGFGGIFSMFLSMLIPVLILVGAIYLALKLWEGGSKKGLKKQNAQFNPDPIDILKQRYARGEITKDEYHELKAELNND